jgi:hypothetical protein
MLGCCVVQAIRSDNPIIFFEHVLLYNIKGDTHDGDYCQSLEKCEVSSSSSSSQQHAVGDDEPDHSAACTRAWLALTHILSADMTPCLCDSHRGCNACLIA